MYIDLLKKKLRTFPKCNSYCIDNIVFKLHYVITLAFLIICALLVGVREYLKEPISCDRENHLTFYNSYCIVSSTITAVEFPKEIADKVTAKWVVRPLVEHKDNVIRQDYYQWVTFILLLQAFLFYIPHVVWNKYENSRMAAIVNYLKSSSTKESELNREEKIKWKKDHYLLWRRCKLSKRWAAHLVLCEILNLMNLIFQTIILNIFLQGNFIDLGIKWHNNNAGNSLDRVFPKNIRCTFYKHGPSGDVQRFDTLCVISLNIFIEKVYYLIWFWFLGLVIVTILVLVWRLLTLYLHNLPIFNKWIWSELSPGPEINFRHVVIITKNLCFTDWLFLYYLGKNINSLMFRDMITILSESYKKTPITRHEEYEIIDNATDNILYESFC